MRHFSCFLILAATLVVAAVSCDKSDSSSSTSLSVGKISMVVPYEGGEFYIGYSITNPKDDGVLDVQSDSSWISDFDFSIEDTVTVKVQAYEGRESRSTVVRFRYISGTDTLSTKTCTVTQELNNFYSLEASAAGGYYYGISNIYNNEGNLQYWIYLSDTELDEDGNFSAGGTYYVLDLWTSATPDGTSQVYIPEGEYVAGQVGENGVFSEESRYFRVNEEGDDYDEEWWLNAGTVTVERSGDVTSITAELEDYEGGEHLVTFSGNLTLENVSLISSLDGDLDVGDFSDVACEARYYGDYFNAGTSNWVLCIYPETSGTGFTIDLCGDSSCTLDSGIPTGTFTVASEGGPAGSFLSGSIYSNYVSGTWLVSFDDEGTLTTPYAPLVDGTVEVTASGESYTVTVSARDDRENLVTGTWTGTPSLTDYTTSRSSASSGSSHRKSSLRFHHPIPFTLK